MARPGRGRSPRCTCCAAPGSQRRLPRSRPADRARLHHRRRPGVHRRTSRSPPRTSRWPAATSRARRRGWTRPSRCAPCTCCARPRPRATPRPDRRPAAGARLPAGHRTRRDHRGPPRPGRHRHHQRRPRRRPPVARPVRAGAGRAPAAGVPGHRTRRARHHRPADRVRLHRAHRARRAHGRPAHPRRSRHHQPGPGRVRPVVKQDEPVGLPHLLQAARRIRRPATRSRPGCASSATRSTWTSPRSPSTRSGPTT